MESIYDGNCSQYEGICSAHLKKVKAPNGTLTTMINSHIKEQELSEFFTIIEDLSAFISEKCVSVIMPFLCQYVYPPCDHNGSTQFITQKQCIDIRDKMCASEWRFVMATEFGSLFPVCEVFGINDNFSFIMKGNTLVLLKCHYQFKEFCGVCLPLCSTFSQYPDQIRLREKITILIAAIMAIIGAIIVFFAAVVRRKEM